MHEVLNIQSASQIRTDFDKYRMHDVLPKSSGNLPIKTIAYHNS
jgi:hypothetical protein